MSACVCVCVCAWQLSCHFKPQIQADHAMTSLTLKCSGSQKQRASFPHSYTPVSTHTHPEHSYWSNYSSGVCSPSLVPALSLHHHFPSSCIPPPSISPFIKALSPRSSLLSFRFSSNCTAHFIDDIILSNSSLSELYEPSFNSCVCMPFITLTQHLHSMCVAHIKTRSLHLTIYSLVTVYNYGPTTFKELDIRSSLQEIKKKNPTSFTIRIRY